MSDIEEPPTKLRRYEMTSQFLEGEVEEDGQEEWLSEGVLTDDDYNITAEQDQSASNIDTSQDGTMASIDNSMDQFTDSQETIDEQNTSDDVTNITADRSNVSITGQSVSTIGQSVSTIGQSVSTIGQTASTKGKVVITNVKNVSKHGRVVSKDLNCSLNVQKTTNIEVTTQGRHFIVDGTKLRVDSGNTDVQDFEKKLDNMEQSQQSLSDFPEDLNAFLIRKKDGKLITGDPKVLPDDDKQSDVEESPDHTDAEDDGNDTDGLLRLLGDDEGKNKKADADDDDETADEEDFNLESPKTKTVKLANNAMVKKYAARKAVPEDDDITDASSDEEVVNVPQKVNRRATAQKPSKVQVKAMETSTPIKKNPGKVTENTTVRTRSKVLLQSSQSRNSLPGAAGTSTLGNSLNTSVNTTVKKPVSTTVKKPVSTTVKTPVTMVKPPVTTVKSPVTTIVKPPVTTVKVPAKTTVKTPVLTTVKPPVTTAVKPPVTTVKPPVTTVKPPVAPVKVSVTTTVKTPVLTTVKPPVTTTVKTPVTAAVKTPVPSTVKTPVNIIEIGIPGGVKGSQPTKGPFSGIGTSKYVENALKQLKATSAKVDKTEPKNTEGEHSDNAPIKPSVKTEKRNVTKPEAMEEEMSDIESETDEESLYDELPSSGEESLNEWFILDIRAERAGDYLPLLGENAEQLLLEEKKRVETRLDDLKKSLSSLTKTSKQQADALSIATAELAELDFQIKAA